MNIFGFTIKKNSEEEKKANSSPSFAPEVTDDGAVVVAAGGAFGTYVDMEGSVRTEAELVTKYREMSLHPEIDSAIEDIIGEAIIIPDDDSKPVTLKLDNLEHSENIKKMIEAEFENILKLLNFKNISHDIFKRWYVDGRLYYHVIIDQENPAAGIKELRYLDPRKIRKIREIKKVRQPNLPASIVQTAAEYYVYNERGFANKGAPTYAHQATEGLKVAKDSILHVTSGLLNQNSTMVLSYLHKAIKPLNQLRTLEDATVIYRLSRAPERRIFYIDVGNLPKMKAEQYLRDMMIRHKNKLVYDATTGEIRDDRKFMTMLEDYWLPRREGGRGTEITTLPGGENLGEIKDVEYFQKRLYKSLNVPISRMDEQALYSMGRATEITRDEVKFSKFISKIRNKFCELFVLALEKQIVLKKIMTLEEWQATVNDIVFEFAKDNLYHELKEVEIAKERWALVAMADPFVGKYASIKWIRENILKFSEDEMEADDEIISQEEGSGSYDQPGLPDPDPTMDAGPGGAPAKKPVAKPAKKSKPNK